MKKSLFLPLFALFFSAALLAQPQLQMNVLPNIGDVVTFYEADTNGVSQGSAGANQNWDFSDLEPLAGVAGTLYHYIAPSNTPSQYASQFPGANFALRVGEGDTAVYSYTKKEANQFSILGIASEDVIQEYSNTDIQLKSLSYNGSFSDDFTNTTDAGTGFIFYGSGSRTITYDAYGTLITPAGTFQNAMRLKGISSQVDSADFGVGSTIIRTSFTVYDWVVPNQPGVLVSVYYTRIISETRFPGLDTIIEDSGVFKSVNFIDNLSVGTFDRPEELTGVNIAFAGANPVSDELSLRISIENANEPLQMLLTDAGGRVVETRSLTLNAGENLLSLPVGHLGTGAYFLTLTDGKAIRTLHWQKH